MVSKMLNSKAENHSAPIELGQLQRGQPSNAKQIWQTRKTILLVFLCCAMPVVLAAYFYYVAPPKTTTNYGTLLTPQIATPDTRFHKLNGDAFNMRDLKGKWVWVQVIDGPCDEACQKGLYFQRQARLSKGKDQHRIERVVFITSQGQWQSSWSQQYPDVHWVRTQLASLQPWLSLNPGKLGRDNEEILGELHQHLFVVDPLGNVMMRFPNFETLEFKPFRRDISRLLWASKVG